MSWNHLVENHEIHEKHERDVGIGTLFTNPRFNHCLVGDCVIKQE